MERAMEAGIMLRHIRISDYFDLVHVEGTCKKFMEEPLQRLACNISCAHTIIPVTQST